MLRSVAIRCRPPTCGSSTNPFLPHNITTAKQSNRYASFHNYSVNKALKESTSNQYGWKYGCNRGRGSGRLGCSMRAIGTGRWMRGRSVGDVEWSKRLLSTSSDSLDEKKSSSSPLDRNDKKRDFSLLYLRRLIRRVHPDVLAHLRDQEGNQKRKINERSLQLMNSFLNAANEALKKLSAAPFDQFPPTVELLFFTLRKGDQGEERHLSKGFATYFCLSCSLYWHIAIVLKGTAVKWRPPRSSDKWWTAVQRDDNRLRLRILQYRDVLFLRLLDAMEIEVEEIDRQLLRERSSLSGVYIDGMKPDPKSSGTTFSQFGKGEYTINNLFPDVGSSKFQRQVDEYYRAMAYKDPAELEAVIYHGGEPEHPNTAQLARIWDSRIFHFDPLLTRAEREKVERRLQDNLLMLSFHRWHTIPLYIHCDPPSEKVDDNLLLEGSLAKQGLQEASMMVADLDSSYSVTEEGFLRIPYDFSVKKFHKLLSRVLVFAHSRRKQICDRLRTVTTVCDLLAQDTGAAFVFPDPKSNMMYILEFVYQLHRFLNEEHEQFEDDNSEIARLKRFHMKARCEALFPNQVSLAVDERSVTDSSIDPKPYRTLLRKVLRDIKIVVHDRPTHLPELDSKTGRLYLPCSFTARETCAWIALNASDLIDVSEALYAVRGFKHDLPLLLKLSKPIKFTGLAKKDIRLQLSAFMCLADVAPFFRNADIHPLSVEVGDNFAIRISANDQKDIVERQRQYRKARQQSSRSLKERREQVKRKESEVERRWRKGLNETNVDCTDQDYDNDGNFKKQRRQSDCGRNDKQEQPSDWIHEVDENSENGRRRGDNDDTSFQSTKIERTSEMDEEEDGPRFRQRGFDEEYTHRVIVVPPEFTSDQFEAFLLAESKE